MSKAEDDLFEDWWEREGQYIRAGGGQYEKSFAYHAWMAQHKRFTQKPAPEPIKVRCPNKLQPGGCTLHNLHCGWPACNDLKDKS